MAGDLVRWERKLQGTADRFATHLLRRWKTGIVFAESCTGGMVAASLTRTPGISMWLCGSSVVYQLTTKRKWLGIPQNLFKSSPDGVSAEIAAALAIQVLKRTPQAQVAASITGRLGPSMLKSDRLEDGIAWIAIAQRIKNTPKCVVVRKVKLANGVIQSGSAASKSAKNLRQKRQLSASIHVLSMVRSLLEQQENS